MGAEPRTSRGRSLRPTLSGLEGRRLMSSTTVPDVALVSATTADSKGVTIDYEVRNTTLTQPLHLGIYRSAVSRFDGTAIPVGSVDLAAPGGPGVSTDAAGQPALGVGSHELTVALADGLPPNPKHPYVLVVADPRGAVAQADRTNDTASFRTYTIGVITHGGVQPKGWKAGPPWERRMARDLKDQGYDAVIAYNWVAQSNHAGAAAWQAPRLEAKLRAAADLFPASGPVDVHFIGHSEGTVVNSQTILRLNQDGWPAPLNSGYLQVTMLDPHPASNAFKGPQYSVSSGLLGWVARQEINDYQSRAKDPAVVVPPNVDRAEVFYQHTPVSQTHGSNGGVYNLWGQVPVIGQAGYFDITAPGISHGGKFGVQDWYRLNVVPTLGDGAPWYTASTLKAARVAGPAARAAAGASGSSYAGTTTPGARVRLIAARAGGGAAASRVVGTAKASPTGAWTIALPRLAHGTYLVAASARPATGPTGRATPLKPQAWLGRVTI